MSEQLSISLQCRREAYLESLPRHGTEVHQLYMKYVDLWDRRVTDFAMEKIMGGEIAGWPLRKINARRNRLMNKDNPDNGLVKSWYKVDGRSHWGLTEYAMRMVIETGERLPSMEIPKILEVER